MPPYVPYVGLSRSTSIRIGRGPGNDLVPQMNMGDIPTSPQTGALQTLFYADIGNPWVRRDLQHHSAIGQVDSVGTSSNTVYSDLYRPVAGLTLTPSGSNLTVAVGAGTIASRFYGSRLAVSAQTVTIGPAPTFGGLVFWVYVGPDGVVRVAPGTADTAAPTYEVWSVTIGGTAPTGGTFLIGFQYNGFNYTTGTVAYNATGAALATAIQNATGGPNNSTFVNMVGAAGNVTGGGSALPAGPATVTFSGAAEGPVVPLWTDPSGLTGGANNVINITRTTQGVGAQGGFPSGTCLVLAGYYLPAGATNAAAATALGGGNFVLTS